MLVRQLMDAVSESLANELYPNASFLGERLLAEHDSDESRYLLALAYQGEQKLHKAFEILLKCKQDKCRYKLAQIALKMKDHNTAEKALFNVIGHKHDWRNVNYTDREDQIPNGAAGFFLLGEIYDRKQQQSERAFKYYSIAI